MKKEYVLFYLNPLIMFIGVLAYFVMGFTMTQNIGEISPLLKEIIYSSFMLLGLLLMFLAFGLTGGTAIAIAQLIYSFYCFFLKKEFNENARHSIYGAIMWAIGLGLFFLCIEAGFIVTV